MTINNNISETYCSLEVAKLLKEKGCDVLCKEYYDLNGELDSFNYFEGDCGSDKNSTILDNDHYNNECLCSAPTLAIAIEWVRLNFAIWIQTNYNEKMQRYYINVFNINKNAYLYSIDGRTDTRPEYGWESPNEAMNAGLEYGLNN